MSRKLWVVCIIVALGLMAGVMLALAQEPSSQGDVEVQAVVGTAFTYQGQLRQGGNPVNGACDFQFSLWNAGSGGVQVGTTQTKTNVMVSNGLFTVQVDFGAGDIFTSPPFMGDARWLAIAVRCPAGSGGYTTLTPRQAVTAVPYALSLRPGAVISGSMPLPNAAMAVVNSANGPGISGYSLGTGISGISAGDNAIAVLGEATGAHGVGMVARHRLSGNYAELGLDYTALRAVAAVGDAIRGESGTSAKSGVYGVNSASDGYGVFGRNSNTANFGYLGGSAAGTYGEARSMHGIGVWGVSTVNSGVGVRAEANAAGGTGVDARAYGTNGIGIRAEGGPGGVAAQFRGNVRVVSKGSGATIIELGEGLDYSEGFDVVDGTSIEPGMVLVIDVAHPGKLTLSTEPYDRRVAGIVAGAQGLGSGVRLGVDGFDYDVALAGRVFCYVDGTYGEVLPGDLLTTSPTPGYAMVVKDHERAQGAILGKAMEALPEGEQGQILVLVTLQ
jgi:hypothetical protein